MKKFKKNFKMMLNTNNKSNAVNKFALNRGGNAHNKDNATSNAANKRKVPNLPQIRVLLDSDSNNSPQKPANNGTIKDRDSMMIKLPREDLDSSRSSSRKNPAIQVVISPTSGFTHRGKQSDVEMPMQTPRRKKRGKRSSRRSKRK